MHQICNNSFQSSFTRLVTWISTQGHVLTRTPAASVMCPNTSWVLCQGKYSFRWWWGIFSEMMVSIRYSLFWKTCFILPTLHCLIFLQFLLKLHLLLKCELVTAFTCRLVSLSQNGAPCRTSLIWNEWLPRCQYRCEHKVRLSQSPPIEAAIYLGVYQCCLRCGINHK